MNSMKNTARLAGSAYLVLAITGFFGIMYVPTTLYVEGDAAATATNIVQSEFLYRLGIVSGLVGQASFLVLGLMLYKLLNHVDRNMARAMLAIIIVAVPVAFAYAMFEFASLYILKMQIMGFTDQQQQSLAMSFHGLRNYGVSIAGLFWGMWLFPFGYLVYKSGMFPKILGILLMVGCFGYVIDFFISGLAHDYKVFTVPGMIVSSVAEFSILFYLLIKGTKSRTENYNFSAA